MSIRERRARSFYVIVKGLRSGLLITAMAAGLLSAETIRLEYTFDTPVLENIVIDGSSYLRVVMPKAPSGGEENQPSLPSIGARILLGPGAEVTEIEVTGENRVSLGTGIRVVPVSRQVPLSADPADFTPPVADPVVYNSDSPYPTSRHELVSRQTFRGYDILILKLHPVEYRPRSGELFYYGKLNVRIETEETGVMPATFRGAATDREMVMTRVDNRETLQAYPPVVNRSADTYDMLILTTPALAASFSPLKAYHDSTGIQTVIRTTADVGSSSPDDVRDYIRTQYLQSGISYVLIGGDDHLIPAKDLYVYGYEGAVTTDMPSDLYFACLDGTFNFDGDDRTGEPTDGDNGGEVDLIAEVYVGRAPADDAAEAQRFVAKTLQYVDSDGPALGRVLLAGEYVGFGGVADYAGNSLDELVDGCDTHGSTTVGVPSDKFQIDKLYDRDWSLSGWEKTEIINRINTGINIVNHYGHSNVSYSLKLTNADVISSLKNSSLCFLYSQGCLAGRFDSDNCWAEAVTVKTDHGAFASVMNARYGFGALYTTDGASQRYDREFWDAVFNPLEGFDRIGPANHDSKEDNLYRINEGCMRWCYYELNLFGDPAVKLKRVRGLAFDYPSGLPHVMVPGEAPVIDVVVRGVGEGEPVEGSAVIHYAIDGGDVVSEPMQPIAVNQYQSILPKINCGGKLNFRISAQEAVSGLVFDADQARPHSIVVGSNEIVLFEDDFETDKGWTVTDTLWQRGQPTGEGGNPYSAPDPSQAYSGSNVFGYNLLGNYADEMSPGNLVSPAIDCSDMSNVHLSFRRWLGVEAPLFDHAAISVSVNGWSWTTVWENSAEMFDVGWNFKVIDISSVADRQSSVYLRWTMGPSDASLNYCGWNIDDVAITAYECFDDFICGDINDSRDVVDISDLTYLIDWLFQAGPPPVMIQSVDVNGSGTHDISDLTYLVDYLFDGGPAPACP